MLTAREQENDRALRLRGFIIYLLYKARPNPVEMAVLMRLLDRVSYPVTRRRLAEEVDYLRSLKLLRVFNSDATDELNEVQQAKLVQQYITSDSDSDLPFVLCVRLTATGINFQEGLEEIKGVQRVE